MQIGDITDPQTNSSPASARKLLGATWQFASIASWPHAMLVMLGRLLHRPPVGWVMARQVQDLRSEHYQWKTMDCLEFCRICTTSNQFNTAVGIPAGIDSKCVWMWIFWPNSFQRVSYLPLKTKAKPITVTPHRGLVVGCTQDVPRDGCAFQAQPVATRQLPIKWTGGPRTRHIADVQMGEKKRGRGCKKIEREESYERRYTHQTNVVEEIFLDTAQPCGIFTCSLSWLLAFALPPFPLRCCKLAPSSLGRMVRSVECMVRHVECMVRNVGCE